jgi:predicted nucleotidyltransferase
MSGTIPSTVSRPLVRPLELHEKAIKQIAARNGATNLRLVGSVARGEEREGSDVDLLVDFAPGISLFDHAHLVEELEALLGVSVDVVSSRGLKPKVRERLLVEARPL